MRKVFLLHILCALSFLMGVLPLASCQEDDDTNTASGLTGWYASSADLSSYSARPSDFQEIEQAIQENRLIGSTYVDKLHTLYFYASRGMFVFGDGSFGYTENSKHYGDLYGKIKPLRYAIHIIDSKTLKVCTFSMFVDEDYNNSYNDEKIATIYRGSIFKSISVYCSSTYYSYAKVDNKLICTDGDIYTVMSDGSIVEDGTSSYMKRFDPKTFFGNQ